MLGEKEADYNSIYTILTYTIHIHIYDTKGNGERVKRTPGQYNILSLTLLYFFGKVWWVSRLEIRMRRPKRIRSEGKVNRQNNYTRQSTCLCSSHL